MKNMPFLCRLAFVAAVASSSAPFAGAATYQVLMVNYAFSPRNLTINAGDTVVWVNTTSTAHTTTSNNGLWDSGLFTAPGTFAHTFNDVGSFSYYCVPHLAFGMVGTIQVVSSTAARITRQPVGRIVVAGMNVGLSVSAGGAPPLAFQWRLNGANLADSGHVHGATSNTLSLLNVQSNHAGAYTVVVSNPSSAVTSAPALLVVRPDTRRPVAVITKPLPNARVTNAELDVLGRVSDDGQVAGVFYQVNSGPWLQAAGTSNWNFSANLFAGTNRLRVYAEDAAGHISLTNLLPVYLVVTNPLAATVAPPGGGLLLPNLNGRMLEVGRGYAMTAVPAPGYLFSNWVGRAEGQASFAVLGGNALLRFLMRSNLVLQANLVTNPFIALRGSYNGLFSGTPVGDPDQSGFINLTLTDRGAYSGSLRMTNKRYPFLGQFDLDGHSSAIVRRLGLGSLTLVLDLEVSEPQNDRLTGSLSSTNPPWTASLFADRMPVYTGTNASPYRGRYTLALPEAMPCAPDLPGGFGIGTVNVARNGMLLWVATLGDGTPVTQSVPLSRDGSWPLFGAPYGAFGAVIGGVTFNPAQLQDFKTNLIGLVPPDVLAAASLGLGGELYWTKKGFPSRFYPNGFSNETLVVGTVYVPKVPVLSPTNYNIAFKCGNLSSNHPGSFILAPNNRLSDYQPRDWRLSLSLDPTSGRFSGSARLGDPGFPAPLLYRGVVLQGLDAGLGLFVTSNRVGRASFVPTSWNAGLP